MMKEKIAIIFPGIGYHCDKPLLYYGKKLAASHGYRIVELKYTGFPNRIRGNEKLMKESFEIALRQAEEILKEESLSEEHELLWISKSIGTAVAAAYEQKHGLNGKNIYFTPVGQTFDLMREKSGIVFHGTDDPWVRTSVVVSGCEKLSLPLYITDNGNHSLETGDVCKDVATLTDVMMKCDQYLGN